MRRALLLLFAIGCTSNVASAQTLEGRLKQIDEIKVARLAYRSDANPFSFVNPQGQTDPAKQADQLRHVAGLEFFNPITCHQ